MNTYDCDFCTSINDNGNLGKYCTIIDRADRTILYSDDPESL